MQIVCLAQYSPQEAFPHSSAIWNSKHFQSHVSGEVCFVTNVINWIQPENQEQSFALFSCKVMKCLDTFVIQSQDGADRGGHTDTES